MDAKNEIYGILNYMQLENFCERFKLKPEDIKANFDGWRKLVLYTEDKVFLFPRDPEGIFWLDMETTAYEVFRDYTNLPVPHFIDRIKDDTISYYEFTIASRLEGIPYSKLEDQVNRDDVRRMLTNLAFAFALWHEIPIQNLPDKILQRKTLYDEDKYKWEIQLLNPSSTNNAVRYVHEKIVEYANKQNPNIVQFLNSEKTKSIWLNILQEIVSLSRVLVHADIHEDQILLESKESMKITGILDWETVMYGHPIWEFNFFEWGLKIWNWWEFFSDFRRDMWKIYLKKRGILLTSLEGLDLFYTLSEFLILLRPKSTLQKLIGNDTQSSLKLCLEKIVRITERLINDLKEKKRF